MIRIESQTYRTRSALPAGGFTMIELLLVLAIMAVAAGFAIPTYQSFVVSQKITDAASKVELEIKRARLEAIKTGQIQMMQVLIGDRTAALQPWLSAADATDASAGATIVSQGQAITTDQNGQVASVGSLASSQWQLDETVIFSDAQVLGDLRSASAVGNAGAAVGNQSNPILFYPDGSTSTARIVVQNQRGRRIAIELRGLAGATAIVPLVPGAAQ